ncbi:MAG TPA: hypothetical protein VNU01_07595 [Egibacteraceae bacterium]|nr:hypothetical protein [Egibacteraceae bacterium]
MRTMTGTAEQTIELGEPAQAAELARELLTAQADAGALVAELMERPDAWLRAEPLVAAVAATARRVAGEVAEDRGDAGGALCVHGPVPAVVWAREVGATQRLLRAALRRVTDHGQADRATTVALGAAAREMRAHVRALAGVNWAVV